MVNVNSPLSPGNAWERLSSTWIVEPHFKVHKADSPSVTTIGIKWLPQTLHSKWLSQLTSDFTAFCSLCSSKDITHGAMAVRKFWKLKIYSHVENLLPSVYSPKKQATVLIYWWTLFPKVAEYLETTLSALILGSCFTEHFSFCRGVRLALCVDSLSGSRSKTITTLFGVVMVIWCAYVLSKADTHLFNVEQPFHLERLSRRGLRHEVSWKLAKRSDPIVSMHCVQYQSFFCL